MSCFLGFQDDLELAFGVEGADVDDWGGCWFGFWLVHWDEHCDFGGWGVLRGEGVFFCGLGFVQHCLGECVEFEAWDCFGDVRTDSDNMAVGLSGLLDCEPTGLSGCPDIGQKVWCEAGHAGSG